MTLNNEQLTNKQTKFANLVAEEGMSNTQAYIIAYNPSKNAKQKSIHEMACRVFANVKVQSRIKAIQCQIEQEKHMRALRREEYVLNRLTIEAELADNASSRIRALELLGKTLSMFSDKVEMETKQTDRTSEEIEQDLKDKLSKLLGS